VARRQSRWRLRAALFLGVGLALTGASLVAYGTDVFRQLETDSLRARFEVRGTEPPPPRLVFVDIDTDTLTALNETWPIRRSHHARLIRRIGRDRPRAIAYDIQFTEESIAAEDNALIGAVSDVGRIVLAATETDETGATNVFGGAPIPGFRPANALLEPDPGGILRRLRYEIGGLKSFAVVTAEVARGRRLEPFDGDTWIDYHGPPGTIPRVEFIDVLQGDVEPGFFFDKIVVVGTSLASEQDLHPTPVGENMPGGEVQANAISTVLRELPLRSVPEELTLALILVFGLGIPLVAIFLSLRGTLVVALITSAAWIAMAQVAFVNGHVVTFVYPLLALVLSSVGATGSHYLLAAFERERVRGVFSRFVPDTVVEQVLARTDEDLRLGGEELYGTAMFTDLRGFTSFAESLPARTVINLLNVYLSEMSDAILAHGGTLVAYMGDGIFAVFGAPIEQDDHADRALAASREMLKERLPRFNAYLREHHGSDGFRMGIGLNSGAFLSGNVGSERRLEYTAIGDTTNTASRLEGMTKGTPYMCFVADTTREALTREADDLVYVDEFEVRGRQAKVKLWALPDPEEEPPSDDAPSVPDGWKETSSAAPSPSS
jgi:adenylate cyclase